MGEVPLYCVANRSTAVPDSSVHRALGTVLLQGTRERLFLMSEVPLPQKVLRGGIPGDGFGIWGRFWSHFAGNSRQK